MSAAERAAQKAGNVSRSMSSQMAAITAAHDKDEDASPPHSGGVKGKLDVMGMQEDMDIKREPEDSSSSEVGGKGGIPKMEMKQEAFEEMPIKEEVKEEPPVSTSESSADVKPSNMEIISASTPGGPDKKRKCSKCQKVSHFFVFVICALF